MVADDLTEAYAAYRSAKLNLRRAKSLRDKIHHKRMTEAARDRVTAQIRHAITGGGLVDGPASMFLPDERAMWAAFGFTL